MFCRFVRALSMLLVFTALGACTQVRFNERERLAKDDMQFDAQPLKAEVENHVYQAREGAAGIFSGGGGGGCGCY